MQVGFKEEERAFFEKEHRRIEKIVQKAMRLRPDAVGFYLSKKLTAHGKTVILKELCVRFPGRVFVVDDHDRQWPCNPETPSNATVTAQLYAIRIGARE